MFKEIYGSHPYSKTTVPLDHLGVFSCGLLRDFFQRQLMPAGAFMMMAGGLNLEQATVLAEKYFGDWEGTEPPSVQFPALPEIKQRRFALVDRPHSAQTKILMGVRTVPQSHPSVFALKLANQVLGGSASARLFLNLREDKGYTYGAYSYQKNYRQDGVILATANVRTDVTRHSIEEIFGESDQMSGSPADEVELDRSKSELIGAFLRQMETPGSVGSLEVLRLLMDLPESYYKSYVPVIRSLEPEAVRTVSEQYIDSGKMVTTLVGDRSFLEDQIREMGELRIYDTQGNRIE
jgi:predicted Zn-dependent peptidase